VLEVDLAFPEDAELSPAVTALLAAARPGAAPAAPSAVVVAGAAAAVAAATPPPAAAAAAGARSRCALPSLDPLYGGRDEEAAAVLALLVPGGAAAAPVVALLAGAGMGKSQLALDAGWRLHRSGGLPGGAAFADLTDAASAPEVLARLGAALEEPPVRPR